MRVSFSLFPVAKQRKIEILRGWLTRCILDLSHNGCLHVVELPLHLVEVRLGRVCRPERIGRRHDGLHHLAHAAAGHGGCAAEKRRHLTDGLGQLATVVLEGGGVVLGDGEKVNKGLSGMSAWKKIMPRLLTWGRSAHLPSFFALDRASLSRFTSELKVVGRKGWENVRKS